MKQLTVVTHFSDEDPKFVGDYVSVEVFLDGKLLVVYGDHYHDKGREKAQGFVDAVLALAAEEVKVEYQQVADAQI